MADQVSKYRRILNFVEEFLDSSTEESEEEEMFVVNNSEKRVIPKIVNYVENVVSQLEDSQFKNHFRVTRATCYKLIEQFARSHCYPTNHKGGSTLISAERHILSLLWFAGNKSTIRETGDRFNMSLSTFMSVQERVVSYCMDILPAVIRFPRTDLEKLSTAAEFAEISGFPNVIGCVDGTYIEIRTPAHKIKSTYTNRHDIPSVTLQGICNAKKQFIDVFTGPSGKLHDSRIFKLSFISNEIPLLTNNGHYHLLGDSAYPIREWLLTPFRDYGTLTQQQKRFNKTLSATRVKIENAFGLLKSRFRQLSRLEFHDVEKCARFILTCCVLHNICIECDDVFEEVVIENNDNGNNAPPDEDNELRRSGEVKRQYICNLLNCG